MALDIFQRQVTNVVGTFSADQAVLACASGSGSSFAGAMVQGVNWNYQLPEKLIGQLGSNAVARVVGRPQGQMTIQSIVGLTTLGIDATLFDACNGGATMTIIATPSGCGGVGGNVTYLFSGVTVTTVGGGVTVDDLLIRRNLTLSFTSYNEINGA